jgi:signal transduction histidine kinase
MAERALRMGATLSIDSAPGRGTKVRVEMPGESPPAG